MNGQADVYLVPLESGFLVPLTEDVTLVDINEQQSLVSGIANIGLRGLTQRKISFYKKYSVCKAGKVQELLKQYNEYPSGLRPFDLFMDLLNESYSVLKPVLPNEWFYIQQCSTVTSPTGKAFLRTLQSVTDPYTEDFYGRQNGSKNASYSKLLTLVNAMRPIEAEHVSFEDSKKTDDKKGTGFGDWHQLFENMMQPTDGLQGSLDTRFINLFLNALFRGQGEVNAI